jgi:hypothetical protein
MLEENVGLDRYLSKKKTKKISKYILNIWKIGSITLKNHGVLEIK